ncbi:MAG: pyridoxal 5'-phosphate synthase glutaminase subunit PdxT [Caldilinea sp.]|nr:pyridoxal 5'-phosphate synthase glutaminase subunit PdxT [Caldilinea sp.]MCB9113610.1 pyridoxal 5'-phosphate synthase glutaminase subunit PdxT [Caldilineaceae bacterium]MCB9119085.1 pyridoxal 5'-phosphate synthase glutaminase subunit PdxT [Caldilineaceae bacterium]MCB9125219.1 pyridoxal 5'-phosphate synthase glutaminase subunit PdxT [Caldilineaceae bacterium]MCO5213458.1 pyridoxal 5'-phosphate synthase glutaminase subunit PdxT [Caldilinea sp.]
MVTIGILALQGAFVEHEAMVRRLGAQAVQVRKPEQLADLDGLIIPGGESTTMGLVAERWGLVEPLRAWVRSGKPTWGTCAGMIMLADRATGQKEGGQTLLGGLDVTVNRNYFGRQNESFETWLRVPALGEAPIRAVFIRAPAIVAAGAGVEVLATVPGRGEDVIAAVRQGNILATAFHPELTDDLRWHALFLAMVENPVAVA